MSPENEAAFYAGRGEVRTYRLVRRPARQPAEAVEVMLAVVLEHPGSGYFAGWRPFDGEYGCPSIFAEEGSGERPEAAIARQLEAMLRATQRPTLNLNADGRLAVLRLTEDPVGREQAS